MCRVIDVIFNIRSETELELNLIKMNIVNNRGKEMSRTIEYMKNVWTQYSTEYYLGKTGNRFQGKPLK